MQKKSGFFLVHWEPLNLLLQRKSLFLFLIASFAIAITPFFGNKADAAATWQWGGYSTYDGGSCTSSTACPTGTCSEGAPGGGCGTCYSGTHFSYVAVCSCHPDCAAQEDNYCVGEFFDGGCGTLNCEGTGGSYYNPMSRCTDTGAGGGSGGGSSSGGACGTATGTTLSCTDFPNCLGGKTVCSRGTTEPIYGTEPAGTPSLGLYNAGVWVGWDWLCSGSEKCFACIPGYVPSNGTCVPQGSVTPPTTETASCGSENGRTIPSSGPDSSKLCIKNGAAYAASNFGAQCSSGTWTGWTWNCDSVSCSATRDQNTGAANANQRECGGTTTPTPTAGSCGTVNGQDFTYQPTTGLCASGFLSDVTYSPVCASPGGPGGRCAHWTWTCGSATCGAWDVSNTTTPTPTPLPTPGTGTIQIPGYCGNAATSYSNSDTQYSGSFCYTGVQEPVSPEFPPQNGSSQWVCKGLTGGTDSSTCTATRNNTLPQTCSTYTASAAIPIGYGSPFNQLSGSRESLLSISCSSTTTGATANAGSTQSDTYTYKTGFVSQNGAWSNIDFSGNPDPNNAGWFKGVATASLPAASSSQNFVAAFICQYDGGKWKCGCRDSACSQNYWTLQAYQR